jgi:hypothetical protein
MLINNLDKNIPKKSICQKSWIIMIKFKNGKALF